MSSDPKDAASTTASKADDAQDAGRAAWLAASMELLEQEKKFSKERARLAEQRRQLPAYAISKEYIFEAAESNAQVPFRKLFGDNNQLIVYHFMFDESWEKACQSCSFFVDGFDAVLPHLKPRASMVAVAHATAGKLKSLAEWKKWSNMPLYSSHNSSFNFDFQVSFAAEQPDKTYNFNRTWPYGKHAPGISVFQLREDGKIYHTYSTFAAGLAEFQTVFSLLDITPEGRKEKGGNSHNMFWLKHKEEY